MNYALRCSYLQPLNPWTVSLSDFLHQDHHLKLVLTTCWSSKTYSNVHPVELLTLVPWHLPFCLLSHFPGNCGSLSPLSGSCLAILLRPPDTSSVRYFRFTQSKHFLPRHICTVLEFWSGQLSVPAAPCREFQPTQLAPAPWSALCTFHKGALLLGHNCWMHKICGLDSCPTFFRRGSEPQITVNTLVAGWEQLFSASPGAAKFPWSKYIHLNFSRLLCLRGTWRVNKPLSRSRLGSIMGRWKVQGWKLTLYLKSSTYFIVEESKVSNGVISRQGWNCTELYRTQKDCECHIRELGVYPVASGATARDYC